MKKKVLAIIIIILFILGIVFAVNKVNNSRVNYELSDVNEYKYMKYYENGKYGIMDREANIMIEANYKNIVIPNPEEDIFVCYDENDNTKVINSKGNELFTKYDKVEPIKLKNVASVLCYEKNILAYEKNGLYGIINFEGKELININGKELVKTEYDNIITDGYYDETDKYVKSGFIVSNTTDEGYRYGYINYSGKEILKPEYNEIMRITEIEDLYLIAAKNGKYGLYNKSKAVIPNEYQSINYDEIGLVILQKNKNYGMADLEGNIKINVEYSDIGSKGIYIYASNETKNDVFDKEGNKKDINFNKNVYETDNENYRISTIMNNDVLYYGIEDNNGTVLVDEVYSYLEYAYKDYFIAKNMDGKLGVINANGKVLIDLKYNLVQKIKDKNMIQILDKKTTNIYSDNLEIICKMKNSKINNENDFIKIYNDKEEKYFNNEGVEIYKDDEKVKNVDLERLPETIGDYIKNQYSLENVYYVKK